MRRWAVWRWKVITESPTTSGACSRTSRSTTARTCDWTSTRSATATEWWGSTLPASEVSAPFGIRMATVAMCSKESGMASRRTRMRGSYRHPRALAPRPDGTRPNDGYPFLNIGRLAGQAARGPSAAWCSVVPLLTAAVADF